MMHPCTKDMSSGWKNMQKRFLIFENNVEFIESFNAAGNKPYKLSINHLADQTNEEFVASHNDDIINIDQKVNNIFVLFVDEERRVTLAGVKPKLQ